jgi:hypothetical protein
MWGLSFSPCTNPPHHQLTSPTSSITHHQSSPIKAADDRLASDVLGITQLEVRRQRWKAVASLTKTVEALVELELQVGVAAAQGNFSKAIDLAVDVQVTTTKNALTMENKGLGKGQEAEEGCVDRCTHVQANKDFKITQ